MSESKHALAGISRHHLDNWSDDDFRQHIPAVRDALAMGLNLTKRCAYFEEENHDLKLDRANLLSAKHAMKNALAALLDLFGGYNCPEVDVAIKVMQEIGEDRWSMQAQMDAARATGGEHA